MKPTHRLTYRTLRLISHQIGRLTPHYLYRFSVKLAQIIFRYYPHRQSQAISNLRSALPNISNQRLNKILQKVYTLFILEFLRFVGSPRTIAASLLIVLLCRFWILPCRKIKASFWLPDILVHGKCWFTGYHPRVIP